jgi:hypothetical protein
MNKKSNIAKQKPRNKSGKFVSKYAMSSDRLTNGTGFKSGFKSAAHSSFIAMPEISPPMPPNPAITPMANGVYHVNTFRSIASTPGGIYRNLDEALRASPQTAKAMLNDISIMGPLYQRWMSLCSYNDGLVPQDENDEVAVAKCEEIMEDFESIPNWTEFKRNLMWASWYGKHVNMIDWKFKYIKGKRKIAVNKWFPIIGDKLIFRNNGRMGYIVHMPTGFRDVVYSDRGMAELFMPEDADNIIHHKYFITDTTWDESMLAIGVEGFGYRHLIYWTYWLKMQLLEWALNAFQIFGAGGIRIAYFEQSNPESQAAVADAMAQSNGQNIILFPRPIGEEKQGAGLEIVSPHGIDLSHFEHFIDSYFNKQIQQMILGWDFEKGTMQTNAGARDDYTRLQYYDANGLGETITRDLLSVIIKYNYPEAVDMGIKYKISVPVNDPAQYLESIQRAYELGLPLAQGEVYSALGFSQPTKKRKVLTKPLPQPGMDIGGPMSPNNDGGDQTIRKPKVGIGNLGQNLS